jgi:hypothetical protein
MSRQMRAEVPAGGSDPLALDTLQSFRGPVLSGVRYVGGHSLACHAFARSVSLYEGNRSNFDCYRVTYT